jgi:hypothetical protein
MYMVDGDSFSVARSELPDSLVSDNRPDSLAGKAYSLSVPESCRFPCGLSQTLSNEKIIQLKQCIIVFVRNGWRTVRAPPVQK